MRMKCGLDPPIYWLTHLLPHHLPAARELGEVDVEVAVVGVEAHGLVGLGLTDPVHLQADGPRHGRFKGG